MEIFSDMRSRPRLALLFRRLSTAALCVTLALMLALTGPSAARMKGMRFTNPVIEGVRVNVVLVDLNHPGIDVRPFVAGQPPFYMRNRYRSFSDLVKVTHCLAAINGTFFDPRTASVLGSMVWQGRVVHSGWVGNAVAVDASNRAHYIRLTQPHSGSVDWSQYRFAVAAGPTLVNEGRVVVTREGEGFHDPALFRPARRSAIGFRENGEMLLVTVPRPVSLHKLARLMTRMRSTIALNLDGGSSSAMYCNGRTLVNPRRKITNILAVLPRASAGAGRAAMPRSAEGAAQP